MPHTDFEVKMDDLRETRFVHGEPAALAPGQARLRVDTFAFTSNNISYAAAGDLIGYWKFFPAEDGFGRVPVWGFADVSESTLPELPVGERIYGYLPMSTDFVVQPGAVTERGFVDAVSHRQSLPEVYNQYRRVAQDPGYDPAREDAQMLLQPLFFTSFLLDDFLDDNGFFGADTVVLTSASSKTSFGLAALLHRNRSVRVVGLTSPSNAAFVKALGCYDEIVPYDKIDSLDYTRPTVSVDMAGNGSVLSALHNGYRDQLKHSCLVGATHWEAGQRPEGLPGPEPSFFFAPSQIQKRSAEWGPAGVQERLAAAWKQQLEVSDAHIRVTRSVGEADVKRIYLETLEGRARPDEGHILSLTR